MHIIQLPVWGAHPVHACSCTAFLYHISLHQEEVRTRIRDDLGAVFIDLGLGDYMNLRSHPVLPGKSSCIDDDHCCTAWITSHASLTHYVQESTFISLLKHEDFPNACQKVACVS